MAAYSGIGKMKDTAEDRGMDQAAGCGTFLDRLDTLVYENVEEQSNTMRESLRALRTNIQFCGDDVRVVLFTSVVPNEGKSTVVQNLGRSFASSGKKVLVVDSDMRKSVLLGRYRIRTESGEEILGLSHYLSGQAPLGHVMYRSGTENLWMVWAGQQTVSPTELLEKNYFRALMDFARKYFDYVLVDCAPMTAAIDAAVVAKQCDGAALIIEQDSISVRAVNDARRQLEASGVRVLGCVLNKVRMEKNRYYGKYYGGYYGKYYGKYYGQYGSESRSGKRGSKEKRSWNPFRRKRG